METAIGRVDSVSDVSISVVVDAPIACRRCASGKGCGAGLLSGNEAPRTIEVDAPPGMQLEVGDSVVLTLPAGQLLRAAFIAYGLPLLFFVAAAGIAGLFLPGTVEIGAIGLAIAGLLGGAILSRQILKRDAICEHFVPAIDARTDT